MVRPVVVGGKAPDREQRGWRVSESTDPEDYEPEDPPLPETTNLTDPKAVRRSRDKQKREQQEEDSFWRSVLNDKTGRRVMWHFVNTVCHGFTPPFKCGPNGFPQPEATWFRAGQYALGQGWYQHWMQHDRDGVLLMLDEHDPRFKGRKKPA